MNEDCNLFIFDKIQEYHNIFFLTPEIESSCGFIMFFCHVIKRIKKEFNHFNDALNLYKAAKGLVGLSG